MTEFRADLGEVLKGKEGKAVVSTLKKLIQAQGLQRMDCEQCGHRQNVEVLDGPNVLKAVQWITEQTQGKPTTVTAPMDNRPMSEWTDAELAAVAAMSVDEWEAMRQWLQKHKGKRG